MGGGRGGEGFLDRGDTFKKSGESKLSSSVHELVLVKNNNSVSWSAPLSICEGGGSGACGAVTPFILVNRILLNRS